MRLRILWLCIWRLWDELARSSLYRESKEVSEYRSAEDKPANKLLIALEVIRVHPYTSASSIGLVKNPGSMRCVQRR
jgi:hypothetical protein